MRPPGLCLVFTVIAAVVAFAWGAASVRFDMFPFPQLRALKQRAAPNLSYTPHYHDQRAFFERFGAGRYDVVFAGDSLVAEGRWPELFSNLRIANRGIGGDRSDGLLDRVDNVLATSAPRVFLAVDINDFLVGQSVDQAFRNYEQVLTRLVAEQRQVFVHSTIFAGSKRADLNPHIAELNQRLQALAERMEGVEFIDLNARLAPNGVLDARYTLDGIHLNVDGYSVWREQLAPRLQ